MVCQQRALHTALRVHTAFAQGEAPGQKLKVKKWLGIFDVHLGVEWGAWSKSQKYKLSVTIKRICPIQEWMAVKWCNEGKVGLHTRWYLFLVNYWKNSHIGRDPKVAQVVSPQQVHTNFNEYNSDFPSFGQMGIIDVSKIVGILKIINGF